MSTPTHMARLLEKSTRRSRRDSSLGEKNKAIGQRRNSGGGRAIIDTIGRGKISQPAGKLSGFIELWLKGETCA